MNKVLSFVFPIFLLIFIFVTSNVQASGGYKGSQSGSGINPVVVSVQDAVIAHIENVRCVNNKCLILGEPAKFDYVHEGFLQKGDFYIVNVDYESQGKLYNVDYYVQKNSHLYEVKKEVLKSVGGEVKNEIIWKFSEMKGSDKGIEKKGSVK